MTPITAAVVEDHRSELDDAADTAAALGGSVIDQIVARRERRAQRRVRHDIPIPGWDGDIVARYRPITHKQGEELAAKARRLLADEDPHADLYALCDRLIASCDTILIRTPDGLQPIGEVAELDRPIRFDRTLAELLHLGAADRARDVVVRMFEHVDDEDPHSPETLNHELFSEHCRELRLWQRSQDRELEESEGEF